MSRWAPGWRGWPWLAGLAAALVAAYTIRHGFMPHSDAVSYWSASQQVTHGHLTSSGLIPAFSDLDLRSLLDDGRAPFVDFPLGYPWLIGGLGALIGITAAEVLIVLLAAAATAGLIVHGPQRAATYPALVRRGAIAWLAISLPIAVESRQAALPEPLFVAGLVLFCLLVARVRDEGRRHSVALLQLAAVGGALGLLRFVGLPLVVVVLAEGWRARVPRHHLAAAAALCAVPGALNAAWAAHVTGRSAHLMSRSEVDFKFAAHSLTGWFTSWRTTVADILRPGWHVPWPYYVVAAVALAAVVAGSVWWLWRGTRSPLAMVPLAVAGGLVSSVLITMFAYDALTKFEPRMMYPPGVLLAVAWAWSAASRVPAWTAAGGALAWAVLAAGPWNWSAPPFQGNATRAEILRRAEADVVISNLADVVHYQTGLPAAYFPTALRVHSGLPRDRDEVMADLPCRLLHGHGVVLLDSTGFLPPDAWATGILDEQTDAGLLERTTQGAFTLYVPTPIACPVG
jgi:hypothetical protein